MPCQTKKKTKMQNTAFRKKHLKQKDCEARTCPNPGGYRKRLVRVSVKLSISKEIKKKVFSLYI